MNHWLQLSIEYANQRSYLDDLYRVYPTVPEGIRDIDRDLWNEIENAFEKRDDINLLQNLLKLKLFPIKDSYIAYLRKDNQAMYRNPATVERICGRLYEMGMDEMFKRASEPKETNRQIGPLFRRWLRKKSLGVQPVALEDFTRSEGNAILDASDNEMLRFAHDKLNYQHDKGLDFVARFNRQYVIAEAKFLTDFGGHQNAQFNDAITTITRQTRGLKAIPVAILDGVLYIETESKMHNALAGRLKNKNIMSSLVLREFLYEI